MTQGEDIVLTANKRGNVNTIRIERIRKGSYDPKKALHVAEGPFKGIIINKAQHYLPMVDPVHLKMEIIACLSDMNKKNKPQQREKREFLFWFKPHVNQSLQVESAQKYFRQLMQPEEFPKDYTSFIKKALILTTKFPLLKRVDIILRPIETEVAKVPKPPRAKAVDNRQRELLQEEVFVKQTTSTLETSYSSARSPEKGSELIDRKSFCEVDGGASTDDDLIEEDDDVLREKGYIENYITVLTPNVYDYQYLPEVPVSNKRHVNFRLRAKGDAHIALSSVYGDTNRKTYEIVIGGWGNKRSVIRDGGEGNVVQEDVTMNILNGHEFRDFWITWANNRVQVGEGRYRGENVFLDWKVPKGKQHAINCLSVSSGPNSNGEWEFVELIPPKELEDHSKAARRANIRLAIIWASKKQRMLQNLEDAYPNTLDTATLLSMSKVKMSNMMEAVVFLKDLQRRGLILEVSKGEWMRSSAGQADTNHDVKVVEEVPSLMISEQPTIAIITAKFCEKMAVDVMMDKKTSYVKYKKDKGAVGEANVYTIGTIGHQRVVSTKLSRQGGGRIAATSTASTVTKLLGTFNRVQNVLLVGVGGGVPNYVDYKKHIRLGDVAISFAERTGSSLYIQCDKAEKREWSDQYDFSTRSWRSLDSTLHDCISTLKTLQESQSFHNRPWDVYLEQGLDALEAEESSFHRPPAKTDRLYYLMDGKMVEVHHPKPPPELDFKDMHNKSKAKYGIIGSGRFVASNEKLRVDFADQKGLVALDMGFDSVLDAIKGSRIDSFAIIRGVSDYKDGSTNLDWEPYAGLMAAAYMKAIIMAMPTYRRSSGFKYY